MGLGGVEHQSHYASVVVILMEDSYMSHMSCRLDRHDRAIMSNMAGATRPAREWPNWSWLLQEIASNLG